MPEEIKASPTAALEAGGSAAAQAYREQLARQGDSAGVALAQTTITSTPKLPSQVPINEARAVKRKLIGGRARVVRNGAQVVVGKMVDISETGACVILDDTLPSKTGCVLEFDIFHDGRRYVFSAQAQAVYGVFSSGKGFKVGFQFGPRNAEASKCISALVA